MGNVKAMLGEARVLGPQTQNWMTSVWAKQGPRPDFQAYGFTLCCLLTSFLHMKNEEKETLIFPESASPPNIQSFTEQETENEV